jgi:iron complex outermembrane receptor protein
MRLGIGRIRSGCAALGALTLSLCALSSASAQRVDDNAATAAEDAFGTTVGNESIGLYGAYNARGFSPVQAGNVRIEGLYFDQQAQLNNRIAGGNSVRVGISAQAYPFPAPTGIADFSLRLPGDQLVTSAFVGVGAYSTVAAEVDGQVPLVKDKLSVGFGGRVGRYDTDAKTKIVEWETGLLARWRMENAEVTGFWGRIEGNCCPQQPGIFTGGAFLPPPIERRHFWGQEWTRGGNYFQNYGVLARVRTWGDWTIRAGLFRSEYANYRGFGDFVTNVQPDGSGDHTIIGLPTQQFGSYSGEIRISRAFTAGNLRHTVNAAFRGRDVKREYGGSDDFDAGTAFIGQENPLPKPTLTFGPTTQDQTRQGTAGLTYDGVWLNVGTLSLGTQKTFYNRDIAQPNVPEVSSSARPVLYNVAASAFISSRLALYASYTKGLEESGVAPQSALNRGEAMPVNVTKQVDAGFRYVVTPDLKLIAGVFQVDKPYYNINTSNIYGALGTVRHRGIELSLSGKVGDSITLVGVTCSPETPPNMG